MGCRSSHTRSASSAIRAACAIRSTSPSIRYPGTRCTWATTSRSPRPFASSTSMCPYSSRDGPSFDSCRRTPLAVAPTLPWSRYVASSFLQRCVRGATAVHRLVGQWFFGNEADHLDTAALHLLHDPLRAARLKGVALLGDLAQHRVHIATDRIVVTRFLDPQPQSLVQLFERETRIDADLVVVDDLQHVLLAGVVLVANLADDLLEQVLQRDHARCAPVLVDHDHHVLLLGPHVVQQLVHLLLLGCELDRPQHLYHVELLRAPQRVQQQHD